MDVRLWLSLEVPGEMRGQGFIVNASNTMVCDLAAFSMERNPEVGSTCHCLHLTG